MQAWIACELPLHAYICLNCIILIISMSLSIGGHEFHVHFHLECSHDYSVVFRVLTCCHSCVTASPLMASKAIPPTTACALIHGAKLSWKHEHGQPGIPQWILDLDSWQNKHCRLVLHHNANAILAIEWAHCMQQSTRRLSLVPKPTKVFQSISERWTKISPETKKRR